MLYESGHLVQADADETYAFVAGLHQMNEFRFEKLIRWLRDHAILDQPGE